MADFYFLIKEKKQEKADKFLMIKTSFMEKAK